MQPLTVAVSTVAIGVGILLGFRQLVDLPSDRKPFNGGTLFVLWFALAFAQLVIAADSGITKPLLALLWE